MTNLCKICSGNGVLKLKYGVLTCETCCGRGEVSVDDEYVGSLELENIQLRAELDMLRKFFTDYGFNELNEAKRELARYKTPNVDNVTIKEIEK